MSIMHGRAVRSALCQKRTFLNVRPNVRFTPKSGHWNSVWNVRFVPKADIAPYTRRCDELT